MNKELNTEKLIDLIQKGKKVSEELSDKRIILIMGITGAGKSTFINQLQNKKMVKHYIGR